MNLTMLETEFAQAAKRYAAAELRLDVRAFSKTRDLAWVGLAGRILEKPGAALTTNRPTRVETRK